MSSSFLRSPTHIKIEYDSDDEPMVFHQTPVKYLPQPDMNMFNFIIRNYDTARCCTARMLAITQFLEEMVRHPILLRNTRMVGAARLKCAEFRESAAEYAIENPAICERLERAAVNLERAMNLN